MERGKQPLKGWWSLPGGVVNTGEQLGEALKREVREETGLEVKPVAVVEIFERIMRDAKGEAEYHYVLVDYLCKVTGGELAAGDDASAAVWVARKDLSNYKVTEGSVSVIERAFEKRDSSK